jgi:hypothetical protein
LLTALLGVEIPVQDVFANRKPVVRLGRPPFPGGKAVFPHQPAHFLQAYPFPVDVAQFLPHPQATVPPVMLLLDLADEAPRSRRVRPYQLLFDTGVWYLYAWDEDRTDIRMFSLSRMGNAVLTETAFTLPTDEDLWSYDYRAHADGSYFGVFHGNEKKHFRVAFFDEAFTWAKERKWAADQTIEENSYSVTVDFTSTQYEKVLDRVLSRGSNARPLEPPELVKDWKDTISEMQKRSLEE